MIPGAEHAPTITVGYVTERGGFYTLVEDIPTIRRVDTGELIPDAYIEALRQLTVTDPDDQRVIWRLAALHYGAGADNGSATLRRIGRNDWRLEVTHTRSNGDGILLALRTLRAATLEVATAALCAAVWGP